MQLAPLNRPPSRPRNAPISVDPVWMVEQCSDGKPRPAWVQSCAVLSALNTSSPLDRAWLGEYKPATPQQIYDAASDIFAHLNGTSRVDGVRSYCYRARESKKEVLCLPDVSIIGVSKCGTTDLYHKMMELRCASSKTQCFCSQN